MASFNGIVGILRAAAEPTRVRLLRLVHNGEFNVKDLTQLLGQSQPRVSRHIKLLADAGLIERYQEGSWVFVRATADSVLRGFVETALAMIDAEDSQISRDSERAKQLRLSRTAAAQTYFNENAANWDRIRSLHVPEMDVEAAMLDALGPGPFDLLLDLGTGTGRMLELFASRARRLAGLDSNREMLKFARVNLEAAGLSNCSVRLSDIYNLPFAEGSADAVVVHQVLHFLESPKQALAEAIRVLKPEGKLLLVDFAPHGLEFLREEHAHMRLGFSPAEITGWLKEGGMQQGLYRELCAGSDKKETGLTVALWLAVKAKVPEYSAHPKSKVA